MTMYAIQAQRFGLARESVRGTAEAAPLKWYPTRGPIELNYALQHLEDTGIRGIKSPYAPLAGMKVGEGKIPLHADPQMLGEFFYSLLGTKAAAQQGGTAAYLHTFTQQTGLQPPSYTFFIDRGLGVLKYNLGCVKEISLKGGVDNLLEIEAGVLFKTEASGSIGSPSFPTAQYLGFQHVDFKIAGSSNTDVKEWDLKIDNGARAHRVLHLSQDLNDVIHPDLLSIEGGFTIYFQNTTERDKFIANTSVAIRILCEGATIASTYEYSLDINVYAAKYKAFPYGEDQGLLAAKVTFQGFYSTSDTKAIQVEIINTDTSYA